MFTEGESKEDWRKFLFTSNPSSNNNLPLYTIGGTLADSGLMLFVGGVGLPCESSLPLFCYNNATELGFPLYTSGEGIEDGAFPISNSLMLYILCPFGAQLPLYVLGGPQPSSNNSLPLYTISYSQVLSSLSLSVPNVDDFSFSSLSLYSHGF